MAKEITENQKRQIEIMRLNGLSYLAIAKKIGCHPTTVARFCKKWNVNMMAEDLAFHQTLWQKIKKVLGW